MFRANHNEAINSIGEEYIQDGEGRWFWFHIARTCGTCSAAPVCYGKDGAWFCTDCWQCRVERERACHSGGYS